MCGPRSRWTRRREPIGRRQHVAGQSCKLIGQSRIVLTDGKTLLTRALDAITASLWMKPKAYGAPKGSKLSDGFSVKAAFFFFYSNEMITIIEQVCVSQRHEATDIIESMFKSSVSNSRAEGS